MLQKVQGALGGGQLLVAVHLLRHGAHLHAADPLLAAPAGQLLGQALGHLHQALQQQGVEGPALAVQDHLHRHLVGEGPLVHPLAGEGVVHVGQGHDLGADGDVVPPQAVGVAPPVPALVVPAADGAGHLHQGLLGVDGQIVHHLRPHHRVGLHNLKFLVCEPAGLVEDLVGDGDLPDVVEGRGGADEGHIRLGEGVAVGLMLQMVEKQLREGADMQHMLAALPVAELHNVAEDVDHQGALFLFFVDLVGHHARQLLLLGVEENGVDHPAVDQQRVEGAADKVGHALGEGPLHECGGGLGGDHDDGHVLNPAVLVHHRQHLEPVHLRHDNIQQEQTDLRSIFLQGRHGLHAVLRLHNIILLSQHIRQDRAVHLRVVRDKNLLSARLFAVDGVHVLSMAAMAQGVVCRARSMGRLQTGTVIIPDFFPNSKALAQKFW